MALTRPKYSQIYDTDWKQSVELATTADVGNLVLANVQPNSIDGVSVQTNYRILVKDQNTGAQNGIYLVRSAGTGSNGWWVRSLDAAQSNFVTAGLTVSVISGTVNGGKEFKLTTPDPITLGTTALTFINPFATASPGGANTQVQFNDQSVTNGTSGFTFNKYTNTLSVTGNVISSTFYGNIGGGSILPNVYITGSLLPSANVIYDLGSPTQKFRSAYFSGNTIYIGSQAISVAPDGTWTFTSNGANIQMGTTVPLSTTSANIANITAQNISNKIYFDNGSGHVGFNRGTPNYVYDFHSPNDAGEILHIEGGVGTQAYFGAKNSSGLTYSAGADQNYAFSGTKDTTNDYALITNGLVRANIQGSSGNVIFTESITVAKDISTKYLGVQQLRTTASNITVRSDMTFLGQELSGMAKLAVGTESPGSEVFTVIGGASYFDQDVTVMGNLFVNGNATTFNANNLSIKDSMIYLADNNTVGDTLDIGIVGSFNDSIKYQHTGFVRDATDGVWKLFSNVVPEPTTTIDFTNATYANLLVGNVSATYFLGNGALLTGVVTGAAGAKFTTASSAPSSPTVNDVWYDTSTDIVFLYENTGAGGNVWVDYTSVALNTNVATVQGTTLSILGNGTVNGSLTINSQNQLTAIANGGTNGVGNIGSSSQGFNTVFAKASSAQYADLAEKYTSDYDYTPGTVLVFGGTQEVTVSTLSHDPRVAGVVTTDPAYLMNDTLDGVAVALTGRVPCRVLGPVNKGDRLVTSQHSGVAQRLNNDLYQPGCIIGKSLEKIESAEISTIEIAIGRF